MNIALATFDGVLAVFTAVVIVHTKQRSFGFFAWAVSFEAALLLSASALLRGVM